MGKLKKSCKNKKVNRPDGPLSVLKMKELQKKADLDNNMGSMEVLCVQEAKKGGKNEQAGKSVAHLGLQVEEVPKIEKSELDTFKDSIEVVRVQNAKKGGKNKKSGKPVVPLVVLVEEEPKIEGLQKKSKLDTIIDSMEVLCVQEEKEAAKNKQPGKPIARLGVRVVEVPKIEELQEKAELDTNMVSREVLCAQDAKKGGKNKKRAKRNGPVGVTQGEVPKGTLGLPAEEMPKIEGLQENLEVDNNIGSMEVRCVQNAKKAGKNKKRGKGKGPMRVPAEEAPKMKALQKKSELDTNMGSIEVLYAQDSKKAGKNKQEDKPDQAMSVSLKEVLQIIGLQKRTELDTIIDSLKILCKKDLRDEYNYYREMQVLLTRVRALDAELTPVKPYSGSRLGKVDKFNNWADANGIRHEGIEIKYFTCYGLGLLAEQDFNEDEVFMTIPRTTMISEDIANELSCLPPESTKLIYALMLESLKPDSFWKPYIDILPEYNENLYYCTLADMEWLQTSNILSFALRVFQNFLKEYALMYEYIRASTDTSPLARLLKENFTYELYRWAASTVMTRQNSIPSVDGSGQVSVLIPFWDMANHQHGKLTTFYQADSNVMTSSAMRGFKKGEQVFIHYGNRPNFEFLVFNGFVQPSFSHDYIPIKLGLNSSDPLVEKRTRLLDMMNIGTLGTLNVLNGPEYISPTLLAFVRVFHMSNEQLDHWLTAEERVMDLMHSDCALETVLETKVWSFLSIRLNLLIRYSRTSLEDLERKFDAYNAGDLELNYTSATCLHFRLLEMRILTAAADYATQRSKA